MGLRFLASFFLLRFMWSSLVDNQLGFRDHAGPLLRAIPEKELPGLGDCIELTNLLDPAEKLVGHGGPTGLVLHINILSHCGTILDHFQNKVKRPAPTQRKIFPFSG